MIQTSLFVRLGEEVVLERSLEITEVLRGEEGNDGDRRPVHTHFGKRFVTVYLVCLLMSLIWRQIRQ